MKEKYVTSHQFVDCVVCEGKDVLDITVRTYPALPPVVGGFYTPVAPTFDMASIDFDTPNYCPCCGASFTYSEERELDEKIWEKLESLATASTVTAPA